MDTALFFLSVVATLALAVLGAIVTGHDDWGKQHRWKIYAAFLVLGSIVAIAQIRQYQQAEAADVRAEAARLKMAEAVDNLAAKSAEETEVLQKMNAVQDEAKTLQASNLALSASVQKLASDTLQRVIGDPDHPPYIEADVAGKQGDVLTVNLYLFNPSQIFPAKDVVADVMSGARTITGQSQSIPPSARVPLYLPNSVGIGSSLVRTADLMKVGVWSVYTVHVSCDAGQYTQYFAIVRTGEGTIAQAVHVVRKGETKPLFSKEPKDFPKGVIWPKELRL
jgi:hypothetical protein